MGEKSELGNLKALCFRMCSRDLRSIADSCPLRSTKLEPGLNTEEENLGGDLMCGCRWREG